MSILVDHLHCTQAITRLHCQPLFLQSHRGDPKKGLPSRKGKVERRFPKGQTLTCICRKSRDQSIRQYQEKAPDKDSSKLFSNSLVPKNPLPHQLPGTYSQTIATHISGYSLYQAESMPGLPSARSWPES